MGMTLSEEFRKLGDELQSSAEFGLTSILHPWLGQQGMPLLEPALANVAASVRQVYGEALASLLPEILRMIESPEDGDATSVLSERAKLLRSASSLLAPSTPEAHPAMGMATRLSSSSPPKRPTSDLLPKSSSEAMVVTPQLSASSQLELSQGGSQDVRLLWEGEEAPPPSGPPSQGGSPASPSPGADGPYATAAPQLPSRQTWAPNSSEIDRSYGSSPLPRGVHPATIPEGGWEPSQRGLQGDFRGLTISSLAQHHQLMDPDANPATAASSVAAAVKLPRGPSSELRPASPRGGADAFMGGPFQPAMQPGVGGFSAFASSAVQQQLAAGALSSAQTQELVAMLQQSLRGSMAAPGPVGPVSGQAGAIGPPVPSQPGGPAAASQRALVAAELLRLQQRGAASPSGAGGPAGSGGESPLSPFASRSLPATPARLGAPPGSPADGGGSGGGGGGFPFPLSQLEAQQAGGRSGSSMLSAALGHAQLQAQAAQAAQVVLPRRSLPDAYMLPQLFNGGQLQQQMQASQFALPAPGPQQQQPHSSSHSAPAPALAWNSGHPSPAPSPRHSSHPSCSDWLSLSPSGPNTYPGAPPFRQDLELLFMMQQGHPSSPGAAAAGVLQGQAGVPCGGAAEPLPPRFLLLPPVVQHRIVGLSGSSSVITIRDFDDKVVSKMALLVDSYGVDEALHMLSHLEHRMRTKQGAMKNGPGYLDVAVSSHLDMLKAQGSCPKSMTIEQYAAQTLSPPVFHELREAVATNRWLEWEHLDQGIVQLVKKLPKEGAVEKLQEISSHSFKNVDNIKGCIMSILNSKIREDRRKL